MWMVDTPFRWKRLLVPLVSYILTLKKNDDKSGYDRILLSIDSPQHFGMGWQVWWPVGVTLLFGWKDSPFIYQTVGLRPHKLFQEFRGRVSLYIDDRFNGERFASKGFWSCPLLQRTPEYSYQSAEATLYIVYSVLANFGYFLGLSKCVLSPVTRIGYLGMIVDFKAQAFCIPKDKKTKFAPATRANGSA